MLVTLGALGLGSLVIVFKLFQGDGKGRSTGLKVYWYKGFGTRRGFTSVRRDDIDGLQ